MIFGEKDSSFMTLPVEMVTWIFKFLTILEKKNIRIICKRWNWILSHPYIGRFQFKPVIDNIGSVEYLLNSFVDIQSVYIKNIIQPWTSMTHSRNKFPYIRNAIIQRNNLESNVISFLKYGCEKLEYLKIDEFSLEHFGNYGISRVVPELMWNDLSHLELIIPFTYPTMNKTYNESCKKHCTSIALFLKLVKIPNMKKLTLVLYHPKIGSLNNNDHVTTPCIEVDIFSKFFGFIERHTNTLNALALNFDFRTGIQVEIPQISSQIQESLRQNLKIEWISIRLDCSFTFAQLSVLSCLVESKTISTFIWNLNMNRNPIPQTNLENIIKTNEKTLRNMNVELGKNWDRYMPFNLQWIRNCSILKNLTLRYIHYIGNRNIQLPTLVNLEMDLFFDRYKDIDQWIISSFKNLETIKLYFHMIRVYLPGLKNIFQGLARLREFQYCYCNVDINEIHENEIREYCLQTLGLNYTSEVVKLHYHFGMLCGRNTVITRDVFLRCNENPPS